MNTEVRTRIEQASAAQSIPKRHIYTLNDAETEQIAALASVLPDLKLSELNLISFFDIAEKQGDKLPADLREFLRKFRSYSNSYGAIVLKGLPQDPFLERTPDDDGVYSEKRVSISEKAFATIMSRLGTARAYADEKRGLAIQNVYPLKNCELKQENTGSMTELLGHTEDGFMTRKCDFLGLNGLRADHDRVARTGVASCWRAVRKISAYMYAVLRKPLFQIQVPSSFMGDSDIEIWSAPMPVLYGDMFKPDMCIDLDAMAGTTPLAERALREFTAALRSVGREIAIEPGDLVIIDNRTSMHYRTEFKPRYDGRDRWLQRLKVVIDPRSSRANRSDKSCIIDSIALEIDDMGLGS